MTFAVIKTGGKQYKVAANDVLKIEKLDAEAGTIVTFDQVLMVGDTVGAPLVEGALVAAELLETRKQKTVIILKKNRRHNYRRRNGHRQLLSTVRITEILTGGAKPTIKAAGVATKTDAVTEAKPAKAKAETKTAEAKTAAPKAAAPKAKAEPKAEAATEAKAAAPKKAAKPAADFNDDIKLIGGVGPALEKKLNAAGVTSLTQIAAWKKADIAKFDEELDLRGRAERDEWVAQAKDLVAGKPPRAKVDQEAVADKAEDKTK
ncbi:50S ribosomal protein L21 [Devosia ginsengisoli]|uniref:50S ribosomal protein L21 n=1 Tax=Devosia ginsengisoli TaxID=400770 RepID=UPI0026F35522|nr:50S ribosomal protein L21 [Devosia ginsengisoli]MCR6671273.1 50S ribosomal protein L21 [Devosia ginsengisoli]